MRIAAPEAIGRRHEQQLRLRLRAVLPAAARSELERSAAETVERDAKLVAAAARRRRCRLGRARDQLNQAAHRARVRVAARHRIGIRRRARLVSAGGGGGSSCGVGGGSSCRAADSAGGDACVVKGSGVGDLLGGGWRRLAQAPEAAAGWCPMAQWPNGPMAQWPNGPMARPLPLMRVSSRLEPPGAPWGGAGAELGPCRERGLAMLRCEQRPRSG